ncbi:MAG: hypothetical protein JXJ17_05050 [Anaerolineae bacterium]|nr:hypothetical protein [Anaerolineae bacterium]
MDHESEANSKQAKKPIGRRWRRLSRRRKRRIVQIGCIPLALVSSLCLWLTVVFFAEIDNYNYGYSYDERLRTFAGVAIIIPAILQLLATWFMTWQVAAVGARTVSGGDQTFGLRQRVMFRRWIVSPLAVFLLRLLMLGGMVFLVLIYTTRIFGPTVYVDILDTIERSLANSAYYPGFRLYYVLTIYTAVVTVLMLLTGPFLRARYNLSLGSLVSTYPRRSYQRPWTAVSFRLALGMFTTLGLVWIGSLGGLVYLSAVDPFYDSPDYSSLVNRAIPSIVDDVFIYVALTALLLTLNLLGQVVLPFIYTALAKKRLRRGLPKGTVQ